VFTNQPNIMSRILLVSNRLPLQINISEDELDIKPSVGGLATGMKSIHKDTDSKWIGWTGLTSEELTPGLKKKVNEKISEENCISVDLSSDEVENFYYGFSNKTIWPLFHYFTEFTEYDKNSWATYVKVNEKFAETLTKIIEPGDVIWIHDYQLLLLPKLIKDKFPNNPIGFFLHIPFPSFEVFRILPWRKEILLGLLGADLIGFHIYNYERHFLSSIRRILGYEINFGQINFQNRIVKAESFPMGIDFSKFQSSALNQQQRSVKDRSKVLQDINMRQLMTPHDKLILSIDRLDYTKGIANRLLAFEYFLEKYPQYIEKVSLIMLCVPSRANVDQYQAMKSEIDELVGRINGNYSTINWTPIWYFYRSFPFENLIDLYSSSDIALITPIRDGMNLVAKEFIASKYDKKGVLILSEMAGAAQEMSEAIIINPNNREEIADAINEALLMPEEEQIERNTIMQKRLKRYNIDKWAQDFINSLNDIKDIQKKYNAKKINTDIEKKIITSYTKSQKRILFLDYDGTLVGFKNNPDHAKPDAELYTLLDNLADDPKNVLVLISGRDKNTFEKWFGGRKYTLIAEHGVWMKKTKSDWKLIEQMNIDWKDSIRPVMENYIDRTPGTFIEEKNYSLVWHYRKADPELGSIKANDLKDELTSFIANNNLEIMEGNKVIEVKNAGINKGRSAMQMIGKNKYDFILGIGDDWTDEYLFEELPNEATTIKVGFKNTHARYNVERFNDVRILLDKLCE